MVKDPVTLRRANEHSASGVVEQFREEEQQSTGGFLHSLLQLLGSAAEETAIEAADAIDAFSPLREDTNHLLCAGLQHFSPRVRVRVAAQVLSHHTSPTMRRFALDTLLDFIRNDQERLYFNPVAIELAATIIRPYVHLNSTVRATLEQQLKFWEECCLTDEDALVKWAKAASAMTFMGAAGYPKMTVLDSELIRKRRKARLKRQLRILSR